jgi:membrane-associated phospholipid phosphatase
MRHHARTLTLTLSIALGLTGASFDAAAQTLLPQPVAPVPAPAATSAGNGLTDIFGDAITDFSRLRSWETLTILSVGGAAAAIGHSVDGSVTRSFSASDRLGSVLGSGETIGGARMQLAGALTTYTLGRIAGSPRITSLGADLIRAQIVTQTLTAGIKMSVGRQRPDGTQYSFPSGHSSVTFATATVLQRNFGWKIGVPAYGLATYVAASRVQSERHFLSDVTFGAALGIVAGRAVTVGKGEARFAVSPAAVPGGAGISFTLLQKN